MQGATVALPKSNETCFWGVHRSRGGFSLPKSAHIKIEEAAGSCLLDDRVQIVFEQSDYRAVLAVAMLE